MDTTINAIDEVISQSNQNNKETTPASQEQTTTSPSQNSPIHSLSGQTKPSVSKSSNTPISNLMFKFPKLNYNIQSRGDGRDSSKLAFDKQTLLVCSILSCAWAGLVIAYGIGIMSTLSNYQIASFVYASLAMIILFPISLIWGGVFVYHYANQSNKSNSTILEAARILSSPAIVATDDVKTLSSTVGHELNILRGTMRDIEDRMQGISKTVEQEIYSLNESSNKLHEALGNISGTMRTERDTIVDLMKIIKTENQSARDRLAEKNKTYIQVSDIPEQKNIPEEPKSTGKIVDGEITYMNDLRQNKPLYYNKSESLPQSNAINPTIKPLSSDGQQANNAPNETVDNATNIATDNPVVNPIEKPITKQGQLDPKDFLQASYTTKPESVILRRERQLYEGVCALTVDLNRELNIELPQDLWSRYMRGERHVFAEHLFHKLTNEFITYQALLDTQSVRKLCNQFIARFETLRERLFDEPDIAVSEYLENSGVGKVYSVLSVEYI